MHRYAEHVKSALIPERAVTREPALAADAPVPTVR